MVVATKLNDEYLLSTEEAAVRLGLAVDTVRRYVYRDLLKAKTIGRMLFFSPSELERFANERRGPGKPPKKS